MAERPIFIPAPEDDALVREMFLPIKWHSGFALVQKEKNIEELHQAAKGRGYWPLLEISSKSKSERGRHMSAFYMTAATREHGRIKLELAFQGSKVFERGGPFTDLYLKGDKEIGEAKRDPRLKESGALTGFRFEGMDFPLEPKTTFYDWLYCSFLIEYRDWAVKLYDYAGFTDVEFNPHRSINCQARSAALFLSLMKRRQLDEATKSPLDFIRVLTDSKYRPQLRSDDFAPDHLFADRR
ncbi:MAG: DUF6977 family protein [Bryobacteraceae bacterium]